MRELLCFTTVGSPQLYNFLVVSYYTEGTPYEMEAEDLIHSCNEFDLRYEVTSVPNLGTWSKNCCYKAEFLLNQIEKHKCPLVWTDVDSAFVAPPTFFNTCTADIALKINHDLPLDAKSRVLSGTLFLNNTKTTKNLLRLWKDACAQTTDPLFFDQAALNQVLAQSGATVAELPDAYITIVDRPQIDPVILHYQASRLYQKVIDGEVSSALLNGLSSTELKELRTKH